MAPVSYKQNYRCTPSLQQFYTGGPFAISSDGSFIVCACNDSIKIVDSSNASIKSTLEGDSENITALTLSPDDKKLFSSSHSRQIRVWDLSTLKCINSWKGHQGPVRNMVCHASGGHLATAGADGKVRVWDADHGFCTHHFKGHKGVVTIIMFHPNSERQLLFSGSEDATIRVWDLVTKKCVATLEKHFSAVTSIAFSEDGWTLFTAGRDKVVNLWDLHDYSCSMTVPTYEVLEALCVIPSGSRFSSSLNLKNKLKSKKKKGSEASYYVTVGERGVVRIWSSESAGCLFEQKSSDVTVTDIGDDDAKRGFVAAAMLPLDQGLLCATADQQFILYSSLELADETLNIILNKRFVGYNEDISDMKFVDEEEKFLAIATNLEQVGVYDLASMSCSYVLAGHTDIVVALDTCTLSGGKSLIATGSKDNSVRLWDSETRSCIGVGVGHTGGVGAVAFSKKECNFFVSGSSDRTIKVWRWDGVSGDGKLPGNLKSRTPPAAAGVHEKDINSLAVAPNDSLVCSGSQDRTARVWRLPDFDSVVVLKGHKRGVWSVEFSPVDPCVITASGDKTIKIWAYSDGSCLKTFEGHAGPVYRASFLTRGTQFVSSGGDGLVKLWTIKTNECIATYDQHEDKVWALAVGKKTEVLASGSSDGVVNLWHDSTASEKEEAFRKEEEGVLRSQELQNAVSDANYTKAIQLAFELRRPHKMFELFSEIRRKSEACDVVDKALQALGKDDIRVLFDYIREWNTKSKLCHVAQFVLFRLFNILPPTDIAEIKGISELLEGLIPYSQRHYGRIDRLVRSTYLLDYTLSGMSVIQPKTDTPKGSGHGNAMPSDVMDVSEKQLNEDSDEDQTQLVEEQKPNVSSKKRKLKKSRTNENKKIKGAAYTSVSAISSPAEQKLV